MYARAVAVVSVDKLIADTDRLPRYSVVGLVTPWPTCCIMNVMVRTLILMYSLFVNHRLRSAAYC